MINLIGVPFEFQGMKYYQTDKDVQVNDSVVVTTEHGNYIGKIKKIRKPKEDELNRPDFNTLFPRILRIASFQDKRFEETAGERENEITKVCQEQADLLKKNMKILRSYLDVDEPKVLITFTADGRVDFRDLVKILIGILHMKIELRQIGPRDEAKIIGGIGPCGLPLCCSTFLNTFDVVSLNMAKNQLLSINIPKLEGQCGKLMCCLKYENDAYSQIRPLYPKINEKFTYQNREYHVTGLNLLSDIITAYDGTSYESFTKEEFERVKQGLTKVDESKLAKIDVNAGVDLSGHGIKDTANRLAKIDHDEKKHQDELKNRSNREKNNRNNRNVHPNNGHNSAPHGNNPHNNTNHNNNHNNHNPRFNPKNNRPTPKKESGFIPVSSIADKSVLNVKAVKDDDKK